MTLFHFTQIARTHQDRKYYYYYLHFLIFILVSRRNTLHRNYTEDWTCRGTYGIRKAQVSGGKQ